jgi:hypothetical protein
MARRVPLDMPCETVARADDEGEGDEESEVRDEVGALMDEEDGDDDTDEDEDDDKDEDGVGV